MECNIYTTVNGMPPKIEKEKTDWNSRIQTAMLTLLVAGTTWTLKSVNTLQVTMSSVQEWKTGIELRMVKVESLAQETSRGTSNTEKELIKLQAMLPDPVQIRRAMRKVR